MFYPAHSHPYETIVYVVKNHSWHLWLKIVGFFTVKFFILFLLFSSQIAGTIGTRKGNSPVDNELHINEFTFHFTHTRHLSAILSQKMSASK